MESSLDLKDIFLGSSLLLAGFLSLGVIFYNSIDFYRNYRGKRSV
jgi:hypothetical protein